MKDRNYRADHDLNWHKNPVKFMQWVVAMRDSEWELKVVSVEKGELHLRIRRKAWTPPHVYFQGKRYYVGEP